MADINFSELLSGIADALEVDKSLITEDSTSKDLEEWDSLGHISIMSFLDKQFNEITERVPDFASATSVREIDKLLKDNL